MRTGLGLELDLRSEVQSLDWSFCAINNLYSKINSLLIFVSKGCPAAQYWCLLIGCTDCSGLWVQPSHRLCCGVPHSSVLGPGLFPSGHF